MEQDVSITGKEKGVDPLKGDRTKATETLLLRSDFFAVASMPNMLPMGPAPSFSRD